MEKEVFLCPGQRAKREGAAIITFDHKTLQRVQRNAVTAMGRARQEEQFEALTGQGKLTAKVIRKFLEKYESYAE